MTEPIAATPGWVDGALDDILRQLPESARLAGDAFAECLARRKAPAAPSDMLGTEFEPCDRPFRQALLKAGLDEAAVARVMAKIETLEADIASQS